MLICTPQHLPRFYELLRELRPHLSWQDFQSGFATAQAADGYQLVGIEEDGKLAALMG